MRFRIRICDVHVLKNSVYLLNQINRTKNYSLSFLFTILLKGKDQKEVVILQWHNAQYPRLKKISKRHSDEIKTDLE